MSSDKRKGELRDGSRIEDGEVYSPSQSDRSNDSREFYERALTQIPVRWNCLDPNDEHSALIVPREDLQALEAERDRLREALDGLLEACERISIEGEVGDVEDFEAAMEDARDVLAAALNQKEQR